MTRTISWNAAALLVCVVGLTSVALGQVPIPLQEQVRVFNSLPAAQQEALIRELQSQLPPAQREAVIGMFMQRQGQGVGDASVSPAAIDPTLFAADIVAGLELEEFDETLGPGDTIVVEFTDRTSGDSSTAEELERRAEFLERLEDGNPYRLDSAGRLYLPGVPPIELAGLTVDQATVRLGVERELRRYDLTLTHLPLTPIGTEALEPYGYELFRAGSMIGSPVDTIPVSVDYVIGPGDTINIQLFGNQNAEYFLTVSRDGTINFPEIGPLNVSGLSFDDVRNLINERVGEQMIGVRASTTLGELRSITVLVVGEVERPGSYTVSSLATMTDVLYRTGGITEIGSLRRIALNREGQVVTTLDLYDLLLRGDTSDDRRLQQGDTIFVPTVGSTVSIDGEVRRPAIYELNGEQTVDQVIDLAGGLRPTANPSTAKLERIVPGRGVSVTDLDLTSTGRQSPLNDGDVLRIEPNLEQLEGTVRLVGNVQRPGLYQWYPGMTLSSLLPSPELVRPMSDLNYVLIRRESAANVEIDVLSADLAAVWAGRSGGVDLALEPRDTIYVFHVNTGRLQYVQPLLDELEAQANTGRQLPVVTVGGQVRSRGEYPLEPGMRVSDLIRAGGGLSDAAYAIEAELTRYRIVNGERRQTELTNVDLAAVLAGSVEADLLLSPYDFLNIREISGWRGEETVTLRGEFVFPGTYPIRQGETLSSLIDRAGGLTEFAFPEGSVLTRVELRQREQEQQQRLAQRLEAELATIDLADQGATDAVTTGQTLLRQLRETAATGRQVIRLEDILAGRSDILLDDGDELFVPEQRQEVTVIGEVQVPTSHTFEPGLGRNDYVERSGGLTRRADARRVYIVRANGDVVLDSGGRWFRRDLGVEVRPGDTIVAPIEVDRVRPLSLWASVTQIVYNMAIAAAAVNSF